MESEEHSKLHIERAIGRARDGVGERIDEIDRLIRARLDWKQHASNHAPELVAAGAAVGFLIGLSGNKGITRLVQLAVPIAVIVQVARNRKPDPTAHAERDPDLV